MTWVSRVTASHSEPTNIRVQACTLSRIIKTLIYAEWATAVAISWTKVHFLDVGWPGDFRIGNLREVAKIISRERDFLSGYHYFYVPIYRIITQKGCEDDRLVRLSCWYYLRIRRCKPCPSGHIFAYASMLLLQLSVLLLRIHLRMVVPVQINSNSCGTVFDYYRRLVLHIETWNIPGLYLHCPCTAIVTLNNKTLLVGIKSISWIRAASVIVPNLIGSLQELM